MTTHKRQPNSHHCFVRGLQNPVGLKLAFYDNGTDEVRVAVEAELTLLDLPDGFKVGGDLEALGWKVYPD